MTKPITYSTCSDVILSIGSYAACAAFIRDARNFGLHIPIANVSFVGSENLLALLEKAGEDSGKDYTVDLINTQVVPSYEDLSLPAVVEYREFMDRYSPEPPPMTNGDYQPLKYSFTSFEGFLNAKFMANILFCYDSDHSVGLGKAAENLGQIDLGIDVPVGFGPENHQALDRVYFTTVHEGKFVPISEGQWESWRK